MAIDLTALDAAATGNPKARVTVNKAWLRAVHSRLVAAERADGELARLKRSNDMVDAIFGFGRPR